MSPLITTRPLVAAVVPLNPFLSLGIDFETSDLVRNLLVSVIADQSLEDQEELYNDLWLGPIESKCQGPGDLGQKIVSFQKSEAKKMSVRYVSDLEKQAKEVSKALSKEKVANVVMYTEFYSLFEQKVLSKMMRPPNQGSMPSKLFFVLNDCAVNYSRNYSTWVATKFHWNVCFMIYLDPSGMSQGMFPIFMN